MPILFEIHITTTELDESLIAEFIKFCQSIKAKPILIELPAGQQRQQPMISKVVQLDAPLQIHPIIDELVVAFKAAGFPVERIKVEVPLGDEKIGKAAFTNFHGGYYEWHGKVVLEDPEDPRFSNLHINCRVSRNALKNSPGTRLLTYRNFQEADSFKSGINGIRNWLERQSIQLLKEEAEYCVYDTNKSLDRNWLDIPNITDQIWLNQLAFDAFLRRAAITRGPFALKGSVAMRQLLPDPTQRIPGDLDFIYLKPIDQSSTDAGKIFSAWMTTVTETIVEDGVEFASFSKNDFWRRIDYAMNDDFPTANTDLACTINGQPHEIRAVDISWNLPIDFPAKPMAYRPAEGEVFELVYVVPLSLQIAWKLHQTAVRFRHKDIIDLILLLELPELDQQIGQQAYQAYVKECRKDSINPNLILKYVNGEVSSELRLLDPDLPRWEEFRKMKYQDYAALTERKDWEVHRTYNFPNMDTLQLNYPGLQKHWYSFADVLDNFGEAMRVAGLAENN